MRRPAAELSKKKWELLFPLRLTPEQHERLIARLPTKVSQTAQTAASDLKVSSRPNPTRLARRQLTLAPERFRPMKPHDRVSWLSAVVKGWFPPVRKWSAQKTVKVTPIQKAIVKNCAPSALIVIHPPRGKSGPFIGQDFNVTAVAGHREGEEGAFPILSALIFGSAASKAADREVQAGADTSQQRESKRGSDPRAARLLTGRVLSPGEPLPIRGVRCREGRCSSKFRWFPS